MKTGESDLGPVPMLITVPIEEDADGDCLWNQRS
jgi:hypothetical protein